MPTLSQSNASGTAEQLMRAYLDCFLAADMDRLFGLFQADAVVNFPYAPEGYSERVEGIAAIRAYYGGTPKNICFDHYHEVEVHQTISPDTVVARFRAEALILANLNSYDQRYVAFLTARDGLIADYTEYWNPLVLLDALGGRSATSPFSGGGVAHSGVDAHS